jgi:hypothetical protein
MKRARRAWGGLAVAATLALAFPALQAADTAAADPASEPVYLYTATQGDTLIGLGKRLLTDPARWPELAQANTLINPNRIGTGAQLRIPLRLMRSTPVPATLVSVTGRVQGGGAGAAGALQTGQTVPEGGTVSTGPDGHVSIRLVDGTLLRLRPDSRLQLRESRELKDVGAVRSGARLERGRVEVEAAKAKPGRAGFTIDTPQGVLGVRGTEFRVAVVGEVGADPAQPPATRGEVLGGVVAVEGRAGVERVTAGFGSIVDASGRVTPPVALLPPPDTRALPALQERLPLRFALTPVAGAARYRAQLASGADEGRFERVLAELTSASPELLFADLRETALPDGDYVIRLRAIDSLGLEGRDADHRFRLQVRPEPPPAPPPAVVVPPPSTSPPPPPPVRETCLRDSHGACVRSGESTLNLVP